MLQIDIRAHTDVLVRPHDLCQRLEVSLNQLSEGTRCVFTGSVQFCSPWEAATHSSIFTVLESCLYHFMFSCFCICCLLCLFFIFHPFKALWNHVFKSALQTNFIIIIISIIWVVETVMLRHFLAAQVHKIPDIRTIRSDQIRSMFCHLGLQMNELSIRINAEQRDNRTVCPQFSPLLYVPTAPSDTIPALSYRVCLCPSSSDNVHTQLSESVFTSVTGYNMELTPAPQSPHRCCPWSWTGCWWGCRTKTTWPGGGSAGSEANAVECCPASTDTGSSSGRSKQLETAWTARRTSSDHSFNNKLDKKM